jgi:hypothetical protein
MRKIAPRDELRKGAIDAKSSPAKREVAAPADEDGAEADDHAAPVEKAKPVERSKPEKAAPPAATRSSPLGALRDIFRPPADGNSGGAPAKQPASPKPSSSKQPASKQPARAGQSRRRRRRSSNKKRKR